MSIYPAINLTDVWRACNPDEALPYGDDRYVNLNVARAIEEDLANKIIWEINACKESTFLRKLITGHRGSGKTTELLRLGRLLEESNNFVVYLDIEDYLDINDVSYLDILLVIIQCLATALVNEKIDVDQDSLNSIIDWFADKVLMKSEEKSASGSASAGVAVGGAVALLGKLIGKASAEIKSASSNKVEIRQNLDRDLSHFQSLLTLFVSSTRMEILKKKKQSIVFIVDGLEKTYYKANKDGVSNHAEIFIHHAEQLKIPDCHVIYTVPIALAFKAQLCDAWPAECYVIPMVKETTPEGKEALLEVVRKRVDVDAIFETMDTVEDFIALSGGAIRDLLRLIHMACGQQERIGREDGARAMHTFLRQEDRLIREEDRELLKKVSETKRVPNAPGFEFLLHNRLVHEYQNHKRWANVHPAIRLLLNLPDKPILKTI